ncbi:MAG: hypothetical protein IT256_08865, partial [Chitinophagaceae bacterium]|nr:hypothetical protein [Chitinophagaceae bacterium]
KEENLKSILKYHTKTLKTHSHAQSSTRESVRDVPGGCPCSQPAGPQRSGA